MERVDFSYNNAEGGLNFLRSIYPRVATFEPKQKSQRAQGVTLFDDNASLAYTSTKCDYEFTVEGGERVTLMLPLAGTQNVLERKRSVSCRPGDGMVLTRKREMVCRTATNAEIVATVKRTYIDRLVRLTEERATSAPDDFFHLINPQNQSYHRLSILMNCFRRSLEEPRSSDDFSVSGAMTRIIDLICWECSDIDSTQRTKAIASSKTLAIAEDYIREHACSIGSVTEIADICGCSLRNLQLTFKAHRGTTPLAFLNDCRLEESRARLLEALPDETVTEIALACGFFHLGRFSIAYRKKFGERPSDTMRKLV